MKTAVLGSGSWGTALAGLLADNGHDVVLWGRDAVAMKEMAATRTNQRYLPAVTLPDAVAITGELQSALRDREVCVVALPSNAVGPTLAALAGAGVTDFPGLVVCASKGLERDTGRTLHDVLRTGWPSAAVALLSGPTFASEVAQRKPAAAVAAALDLDVTVAAQRLLSNERFRVYTSRDVIGVAVGGALKNVIAIAAGCSDALGFGLNARAAIITRGLAEIGRLAESLGGDPLTLAGLAGLGDLVLTCTGDLSRNRTVGFALGRGEPLPAIAARLGQVAEGVETAVTAMKLADHLSVDLPITTHVAKVLTGQLTPGQAVAALLSREVSSERVTSAS